MVKLADKNDGGGVSQIRRRPIPYMIDLTILSDLDCVRQGKDALHTFWKEGEGAFL